MDLTQTQKQSQGGRSSPKTDPVNGGGHSRFSSPDRTTVAVNHADAAQDCPPLPNAPRGPSPDLSPSPSEVWTQACGSVRKSRTHDGVTGTGLEGPDSSDEPSWTDHGRLINSASFSGFGASPVLLCENPNASGSSREMIDFRNLTPQVPFVPSIAKSIPKKRVFLRRPRKAIKDLFISKKHSSETAGSPCVPVGERRGLPLTSKRIKKSSRRHDRTHSSHETDGGLSDSSSELETDACEDAASLKSFGSQAGCGEIFADEEYLVPLEGSPKVEPVGDVSERPKQKPPISAFQGGKEQMASPAQAEVLDLFEMWETFNRTILYSQNSSSNSNTVATPVSISPSTNTSGSLLQSPAVSVAETEIKELRVDMTTPKSENQESTSDEGYCEDHTRSSVTPVVSEKFPRDTYSGDALYELFYDPSESEITPIFNDDVDSTHSIMGQYTDLPLSMYSFHIGSEENLAPPLALDVINHDLLQSNWVGKDCLLKLCDTEISLAMGIVNWMKQTTVNGGPSELASPEISSVDNRDVFPTETARSKEIRSGEALRTAGSKEEKTVDRLMNRGQLNVLSVDASGQQDRAVSTVNTPESQPRTPMHQVCFRIFNMNSPLTPNKDLSSPVASTPGSGTSSLFVLAINKESLCEFCKSSLRTGAKELHLCLTCTSFIERIKTSELWARANLHQSRKAGTSQSLKGGLLPSPCSSYGVASDISLRSVVEQCASQFSSLAVNTYQQNISDCKTRDDCIKSEQDGKFKKDCTQKNIRIKHRRKGKTAIKCGLRAGHDPNVKDGFVHAVPSTSLMESGRHDLVTINDCSDLDLETYNRPFSPKTNLLSDPDISQSSRPTSLPLLNSACSEFSGKHHHSVPKVRDKPHERSRRPRKTTVKREGLQDVFQEEKKVERRHRMKK